MIICSLNALFSKKLIFHIMSVTIKCVSRQCLKFIAETSDICFTFLQLFMFGLRCSYNTHLSTKITPLDGNSEYTMYELVC